MARIRYLKPDFFKDEHIKDLPYAARLFYQGLWCIADREGRLEDRPERLKIEIMPYDKIDIEKTLSQLAEPKKNSTRPFIIRYQIGEEKYIQIVKWLEHQRPHHTEKKSIIPPPTDINGEVSVKRPLRTAGEGEGNGEGNGDGEEVSKKETMSLQIQEIWDFYLETFKNVYKPTKFSSKRKGHIKARLKTYPEKQIKEALRNIENDPFLCGVNPQSKFYATPEYCFRDDETIEKWLNCNKAQPDDPYKDMKFVSGKYAIKDEQGKIVKEIEL